MHLLVAKVSVVQAVVWMVVVQVQPAVLVVLLVVQEVLLIWSHVIIYGEKPTFNLLLNT